MRQLRITHVCDDMRINGLSTVVLSLANESVRRGHDVAILAGREGVLWDDFTGRREHRTSTKRRTDRLRGLQQMCRVVRDSDVVHVHQRAYGVTANLLRGSGSARVVEHVHSVF